MQIILTNGETIDLTYNFLILKYLEQYPGGIKKMKQDMKNERNNMNLACSFVYAVIRANYSKTLTYENALRLVPIPDIYKIYNWLEKEMKAQEEFKKKQSMATTKKSKRR